MTSSSIFLSWPESFFIVLIWDLLISVKLLLTSKSSKELLLSFVGIEGDSLGRLVLLLPWRPFPSFKAFSYFGSNFGKDLLLSSFFNGDLLSLTSFAPAASFPSFLESFPSFFTSFPPSLESLGASFPSFFESFPSFLASFPASFVASLGASFESFFASFFPSFPVSFGCSFGASLLSFLASFPASFESFLFLSSFGGDGAGYCAFPPFLSSGSIFEVLFLSSALGGSAFGGSCLGGSCFASE